MNVGIQPGVRGGSLRSTGSIIWERAAPVTAAIHAGDWLLKLVLIAVIIGLLH
jgi:hypothetical protein